MSQERMHRDIMELLARAARYDDKPHLLYSQVRAMGERYLRDAGDRARVRKLMDAEYVRDRRRP